MSNSTVTALLAAADGREEDLKPLIARIIIDSLGRRWDPLKHPRDRKGRFIETFAEIRGGWKTWGGAERDTPAYGGRVLGVDEDGNALVEITHVDDDPDNPFKDRIGQLEKVPLSDVETVERIAKIARPLNDQERVRFAKHAQDIRGIDPAAAAEIEAALATQKKDEQIAHLANARDLLNDNDDDAVSPAIRDAIWNVMDDLGERPNNDQIQVQAAQVIHDKLDAAPEVKAQIGQNVRDNARAAFEAAGYPDYNAFANHLGAIADGLEQRGNPADAVALRNVRRALQNAHEAKDRKSRDKALDQARIALTRVKNAQVQRGVKGNLEKMKGRAFPYGGQAGPPPQRPRPQQPPQAPPAPEPPKANLPEPVQPPPPSGPKDHGSFDSWTKARRGVSSKSLRPGDTITVAGTKYTVTDAESSYGGANYANLEDGDGNKATWDFSPNASDTPKFADDFEANLMPSNMRDSEGPFQPTDVIEPPQPEQPSGSISELMDMLDDIPFDEIYVENGQVKHRNGTGKIIDYKGRKIVVMDVNGVKVPFYLSSGQAGKKNVESGKWYPFFGFDPESDWLNKGSSTQINDYYGSPELRQAAEWLDATFGDVRNDKHPQVATEGPHWDHINNGLGITAVENNTPDAPERLDENIAQVVANIRGGQPTVRPSASQDKTPEIGPGVVPEARRPIDRADVSRVYDMLEAERPSEDQSDIDDPYLHNQLWDDVAAAVRRRDFAAARQRIEDAQRDESLSRELDQNALSDINGELDRLEQVAAGQEVLFDSAPRPNVDAGRPAGFNENFRQHLDDPNEADAFQANVRELQDISKELRERSMYEAADIVDSALADIRKEDYWNGLGKLVDLATEPESGADPEAIALYNQLFDGKVADRFDREVEALRTQWKAANPIEDAFGEASQYGSGLAQDDKNALEREARHFRVPDDKPYTENDVRDAVDALVNGVATSEQRDIVADFLDDRRKNVQFDIDNGNYTSPNEQENARDRADMLQQLADNIRAEGGDTNAPDAAMPEDIAALRDDLEIAAYGLDDPADLQDIVRQIDSDEYDDALGKLRDLLDDNNYEADAVSARDQLRQNGKLEELRDAFEQIDANYIPESGAPVQMPEPDVDAGPTAGEAIDLNVIDPGDIDAAIDALDQEAEAAPGGPPPPPPPGGPGGGGSSPNGPLWRFARLRGLMQRAKRGLGITDLADRYGFDRDGRPVFAMDVVAVPQGQRDAGFKDGAPARPQADGFIIRISPNGKEADVAIYNPAYVDVPHKKVDGLKNGEPVYIFDRVPIKDLQKINADSDRGKAVLDEFGPEYVRRYAGRAAGRAAGQVGRVRPELDRIADAQFAMDRAGIDMHGNPFQEGDIVKYKNKKYIVIRVNHPWDNNGKPRVLLAPPDAPGKHKTAQWEKVEFLTDAKEAREINLAFGGNVPAEMEAFRNFMLHKAGVRLTPEGEPLDWGTKITDALKSGDKEAITKALLEDENGAVQQFLDASEEYIVKVRQLILKANIAGKPEMVPDGTEEQLRSVTGAYLDMKAAMTGFWLSPDGKKAVRVRLGGAEYKGDRPIVKMRYKWRDIREGITKLHKENSAGEIDPAVRDAMTIMRSFQGKSLDDPDSFDEVRNGLESMALLLDNGGTDHVKIASMLREFQGFVDEWKAEQDLRRAQKLGGPAGPNAFGPNVMTPGRQVVDPQLPTNPPPAPPAPAPVSIVRPGRAPAAPPAPPVPAAPGGGGGGPVPPRMAIDTVKPDELIDAMDDALEPVLDQMMDEGKRKDVREVRKAQRAINDQADAAQAADAAGDLVERNRNVSDMRDAARGIANPEARDIAVEAVEALDKHFRKQDFDNIMVRYFSDAEKFNDDDALDVDARERMMDAAQVHLDRFGMEFPAERDALQKRLNDLRDKFDADDAERKKAPPMGKETAIGDLDKILWQRQKELHKDKKYDEEDQLGEAQGEMADALEEAQAHHDAGDKAARDAALDRARNAADAARVVAPDLADRIDAAIEGNAARFAADDAGPVAGPGSAGGSEAGLDPTMIRRMDELAAVDIAAIYEAIDYRDQSKALSLLPAGWKPDMSWSSGTSQSPYRVITPEGSYVYIKHEVDESAAENERLYAELLSVLGTPGRYIVRTQGDMVATSALGSASIEDRGEFKDAFAHLPQEKAWPGLAWGQGGNWFGGGPFTHAWMRKVGLADVGLADEDSVIRLVLLNAMAGNSDRHWANYKFGVNPNLPAGRNGYILPLDHGRAFRNNNINGEDAGSIEGTPLDAVMGLVSNPNQAIRLFAERIRKDRASAERVYDETIALLQSSVQQIGMDPGLLREVQDRLNWMVAHKSTFISTVLKRFK